MTTSTSNFRNAFNVIGPLLSLLRCGVPKLLSDGGDLLHPSAPELELLT